MTQFVYGKNVVKQMLKDGTPIKHFYLAVEDKELEQLAKKRNLKIEKCNKDQMSKMVKANNHQGVAVVIEEYRTYSLKEILESIPENQKGWLLMLDELEDPHNLGAILRTCDAAGVHGVIIKKDRAVGLTPVVAKVSAGAIDTVKVHQATNLTQTLKELKSTGYWVVGTDMKGTDYRKQDYDMPIVLVIGNEGKGISRLVKEECDFMVTLPMRGKIQSLNASVATGILLYEIGDKRFPL